MPTLDHSGTPLEVNERGFLAEPEQWSREIALFLAETQEGLTGLGDDHWTVIESIRGFYEEHGLAPMVRVLCRATRFKLKYVYELFPSGPAHGACKLAGLPGPDGCI